MPYNTCKTISKSEDIANTTTLIVTMTNLIIVIMMA